MSDRSCGMRPTRPLSLICSNREVFRKSPSERSNPPCRRLCPGWAFLLSAPEPGLHGPCSGGRADLGSFASFQPMPLRTRRSAFDHAEWIFELKYDGFRALAFIEAAMPARFAQWQLVQSFPVPESRITT